MVSGAENRFGDLLSLIAAAHFQIPQKRIEANDDQTKSSMHKLSSPVSWEAKKKSNHPFQIIVRDPHLESYRVLLAMKRRTPFSL